MYSYRIEQAVRAAAVLHKNQVRKGDMPYPYITHLFSVAFMLQDYTNDENVIVAALLHDTIEDTDYTLDELQEDFGGTVRDIVSVLTEPGRKANGQDLPWRDKKKAYIKQLANGPTEALLIAAADKAHNMRSAVEAYYDNLSQYSKDFGGTLDERLEQYQAFANLLNRKLQNDIIHEFNHVFTEYKEFINRVKKYQAGYTE